jgi:Family of unknown function (DUF6880)
MSNNNPPGLTDGDLRKLLSGLTKRQLIDRLVDICRIDLGLRRQLIEYVKVAKLGEHGTGLTGVADEEDLDLELEADPPSPVIDPITRGKEMLALGRRKEAFDILWTSFTESLNQDYLRQALALASPSERAKLQSAAFEIVENHPDPDLALCFLSQWGAHDRLALLVERRGKELSWQRHSGLELVAKSLSESNPEQAWDLLRLMLVDILDTGHETEYRLALRFVEQMRTLAEQGGFLSGHGAFLQQLQSDYPEKETFWERAAKTDLFIDSK